MRGGARASRRIDGGEVKPPKPPPTGRNAAPAPAAAPKLKSSAKRSRQAALVEIRVISKLFKEIEEERSARGGAAASPRPLWETAAAEGGCATMTKGAGLDVRPDAGDLDSERNSDRDLQDGRWSMLQRAIVRSSRRPRRWLRKKDPEDPSAMVDETSGGRLAR
jgi:hypothetical protein